MNIEEKPEQFHTLQENLNAELEDEEDSIVILAEQPETFRIKP